MQAFTLQPRRSIAKRLIVYVVLFSAMITLIISSIQLYRDYLRDVSLINSRLQQIEHVNLRTLSNSLWVADVAELNIHLSGILRLPDMQYLEIREGDKIWAAVGSDQHKNVITRTLPMTHVYRDKTQSIGTLKVVASLDGVYDRLIQQAIVILVSNGIKTFLVAGFILFIFQQLVTRHLVKIANYATSHGAEQLGSQLQLDRQTNEMREQDELGTVVSALNTMQVNLKQYFTALKDSETALRHQQEHLEELVKERTAVLQQQALIIDQIHDSVVSTDLNGNITSWNKGAERLYGYSTEEAHGKHISLIYPDDEKEFLENGVINPVLEKKEHETEVKMQRKNGEIFYAHLALSLLHDTSGKIKGMIGYAMDISARKQAEMEAQRKTVELQAANKELEAFAYSVSHDLRAPLRSIDGFSKMVIEDYAEKLDDAGKDYLNRIHAGAMRMSQIIDDLLDLSRYTRIKMHPTSIDLTQLAHDIVDQLRQHEPERHVDIVIQEGLHDEGDKGLMKVVLENLLNNAWKYTAKTGDAHIEFSCTRKNHEKVYCVRDNGAGFNMKYASKLFGVFQRLHSHKDFPGIGIGLATVQRVIKRHGGRIWAEASPNAGASFFFTLNDTPKPEPSRISN